VRIDLRQLAAARKENAKVAIYAIFSKYEIVRVVSKNEDRTKLLRVASVSSGFDHECSKVFERLRAYIKDFPSNVVIPLVVAEVDKQAFSEVLYVRD
jgi:hypothetical protein